MKSISQIVIFDDEGSLQDVLAAKGVGAQGTNESLKKLIDAGTAITILVPGMPPRALIRKTALEPFNGGPLSGNDLIALPFA